MRGGNSCTKLPCGGVEKCGVLHFQRLACRTISVSVISSCVSWCSVTVGRKTPVRRSLATAAFKPTITTARRKSTRYLLMRWRHRRVATATAAASATTTRTTMTLATTTTTTTVSRQRRLGAATVRVKVKDLTVILKVISKVKRRATAIPYKQQRKRRPAPARFDYFQFIRVAGTLLI